MGLSVLPCEAPTGRVRDPAESGVNLQRRTRRHSEGGLLLSIPLDTNGCRLHVVAQSGSARSVRR
jgi:hypothetical protein